MVTLSLSALPESMHGLFFALRERIIEEGKEPRDNTRHWEDALRSLVLVKDIRATADLMVDLEQHPPRDEPVYQMVVDGRERFYRFGEAGAVFDSGMMKVDTGQYVLDPGFKLRPLTKDDARKISDEADEHSARK